MGVFNTLFGGGGLSDLANDTSDAGKLLAAIFSTAAGNELKPSTMETLNAIPEGTSQSGGMTLTKTTTGQARNNAPTAQATSSKAPEQAAAKPESRIDIANRLYGK